MHPASTKTGSPHGIILSVIFPDITSGLCAYLTSIIYIPRTYPTLPPKKERIRRDRLLVRKVVKQRIRWGDVYGPDFVPNPLFLLYKTITTRKTTTTTTPPPPKSTSLDHQKNLKERSWRRGSLVGSTTLRIP